MDKNTIQKQEQEGQARSEQQAAPAQTENESDLIGQGETPDEDQASLDQAAAQRDKLESASDKVFHYIKNADDYIATMQDILIDLRSELCNIHEYAEMM